MPACFLSFILFMVSFDLIAQDKFISVGSGGGFAGTVTVFKITPDGKVFKGSGIGDIKFTLCGKIEKAKAKDMIARGADQVGSKTFNHPGNLFYFISYTDDNNEQKVTWGEASHPAPEEITKLYEEIQAIVDKVNYRPIE